METGGAVVSSRGGEGRWVTVKRDVVDPDPDLATAAAGAAAGFSQKLDWSTPGPSSSSLLSLTLLSLSLSDASAIAVSPSCLASGPPISPSVARPSPESAATPEALRLSPAAACIPVACTEYACDSGVAALPKEVARALPCAASCADKCAIHCACDSGWEYACQVCAGGGGAGAEGWNCPPS